MNPNLKSIVAHFIKFCKEELNIQELPNVTLITDREFVSRYRSFGEYNPADKSIKVFYPGRNTADILRSLAHELTHHRQEELGMIDIGSGNTGTDIENEANAMAGILMREYGKINIKIYDLERV